jgi:shikimate dehydrogenase
VLGAGGSARAIAAALARRGVPVAVVNRTWVRAEGLATEFNERLGEQRVRPIAETDEEGVAAALLAAGLLVNTTSLGMAPAVDAMPRVPLGALHSELFVYDLIYNPLETRLLREARARGVPGTHGAGMLAHQGALALELWTGRPAPAALMEQVVLETLSARTVDRMG